MKRILINVKEKSGVIIAASGKTRARNHTGNPLKAVRIVACKRRFNLRTSVEHYWEDDMRLEKISDSAWIAEWPEGGKQ